MDPVRIWKANQSLSTLLLSFLFLAFGLSIYLFGTLPKAAAETPKKGGFYNLFGGPGGEEYITGGTAYLDWRDFEPEEGVYRWELLKNPDARFISWLGVFEGRLKGYTPYPGPVPARFVHDAYMSGKKVRLKLRVTEGALPLWLYGGEDAQGVRSSSYGTICACKTYAQAWSKTVDCNPQSDIVIAITYPLYPEKEDNAEPVWWNPIFQEKMKKVLKVIGQFVENDPVYSSAVEFVEASVGSYGEMILYGKSDTFLFDTINHRLFRGAGYTNARYSEAVQKVIGFYMEAFPSFPIALSIGSGLYSGPYDDGSGITSVPAEVIPKVMARYGSKVYLKFAGFGGNRADHTFKNYCPDKTRCIYETFGSIAQWRIDDSTFPFFCYEKMSQQTGCPKETPAMGAARFKRTLSDAVAVSPSDLGSSNPSESNQNPSVGNQPGTGTDTATSKSIGSARSAGSVVDLDGDGRDDVLWFDGEPGPVFAWYFKGDRFTKVDIHRDVETPNWRMGGGGNLRGDGSHNIFWHNVVTGKVYTWYLDSGKYLGDAKVLLTPGN